MNKLHTRHPNANPRYLACTWQSQSTDGDHPSSAAWYGVAETGRACRNEQTSSFTSTTRTVALRDSKLCFCQHTFNECHDVAKQVSSFLVEQLLALVEKLLSTKLPDDSTASHDDQNPTTVLYHAPSKSHLLPKKTLFLPAKIRTVQRRTTASCAQVRSPGTELRLRGKPLPARHSNQ